MSDETKLNPELSELEHSLLNLAVPNCSLNRDELMYRSGWEAALATSTDSAQLSLPNAGTGRRWLLPTLSVLSSAAAILFGIMLLNQNMNQGEAELVVASNVVPVGVEIARPVSSEQTEGINNDTAVVPDLFRRVMELPTGQTLCVGMAVGNGFPIETAPSFHSQDSPSTKNSPPPMTQQELLDELLPNRINRTPRWPLFRIGGNS